MMKDTMAFQILALYREFLAYTTKQLKNLGLNFGQLPFILYTGKNPDCMQAELTKALKLDWGYSQRSIAKLTETGFMTKEHNAEKNCNFLKLTEKGEKAFDACHSVFASWDKIKSEKCSEEEKQTLILLLKKILL